MTRDQQYAGWIMQESLEQTGFMLDRWLYWEIQRSLGLVVFKVNKFVLFSGWSHDPAHVGSRETSPGNI